MTEFDGDPKSSAVGWRCPKCGELVEPNFDICWSCGTSRDGGTVNQFAPEVVPTIERTSCAVCGYDLRGLDRERCPECGTPFDPHERDTISPAEFQSRSYSIVTIIAIALLAMGLIAGMCSR